MSQINIETEEFVKNLKVTFFDIASQNQTIMDDIELYLSKEQDPQKVEDLQNLWASYHETVRTFLNSVEVISDALYKLQACNRSFDEIVQEKKAMIDEHQLQVPNEAISEIASEENTMEKNVEATEVVEEAPQEVVENVTEAVEEAPQEVVEEVTEAVEETPQEVVDEVTEVVEETPQEVVEATEAVEETPQEVVETTEVVEEAPQEVVETTKAVEDNPQEVVETTEVVEEAPQEVVETTEVVEDNPIPELNNVSNENSPVVSSGTEEVSLNNETPDVNEESTPLILPIIEEANEENENEKADSIVSLTNSSVISDLPSLETTPEDQNDNNKSMVFHKGMLVNDRAILINTTQATKLRDSIPQQKLLFNDQVSNEDVVSENQLEEMMNQLSTLYEEGKTKEAEEMSEKISALNKKLTSAM